ncbi:MAG: glycosyltransferase family 2 protein, partial [Tenericutes bacterium]|nr:glycosyltransferase family 2 protein [Mycoplasmatota bacterium]
MKIDVIVPTYNEEGSVERFVQKTKETLKNIDFTIIFVNDGSTDKTRELLKNIYDNNKECVKIINFSRNFGKESAIYAGLLHSKGDYACIIDCDLQQNPEYIKKMYNFLNDNQEYDSVCMCQRQNKKRFFQKAFYKIMASLSSIEIVDGASDFRMFRRKMVKSILELSEKNRFSKGIFSYIGFDTYYDEYIVENRQAGKTKWSGKQLFNYAFTGIISFSTKPLRLATYTGVLTSLIAFLYLLFIVIETLILGKVVPGYASVMCVLLFLGGIQLLFLGIIGEYIG